MTATNRETAAFSRYLPIEPDALAWGLHVIDAGFTTIPPNTPYPPGQHPDGYMLTWEHGRVLNEYQLVYITDRGGSFESRKAGVQTIDAGDLFLLFPGEWHRYQPNASTGWDENWIGFNGSYADQLMSRFFPVDQPILRVGHNEELLRLVRSVAQLMQTTPLGYRQMMAGNTIAALARARSLMMRKHAPDKHHEHKIHQACTFLLEHAIDTVDLKALAKKLGFSYSRFRAVFKEQTGMSPRQYQLEIRINRAKDLLTQSDHTVSAISDRLGFCSIYYFSRLFKQRTGLTPSSYRKR